MSLQDCKSWGAHPDWLRALCCLIDTVSVTFRTESMTQKESLQESVTASKRSCKRLLCKRTARSSCVWRVWLIRVSQPENVLYARVWRRQWRTGAASAVQSASCEFLYLSKRSNAILLIIRSTWWFLWEMKWGIGSVSVPNPPMSGAQEDCSYGNASSCLIQHTHRHTHTHTHTQTDIGIQTHSKIEMQVSGSDWREMVLNVWSKHKRWTHRLWEWTDENLAWMSNARVYCYSRTY